MSGIILQVLGNFVTEAVAAAAAASSSWYNYLTGAGDTFTGEGTAVGSLSNVGKTGNHFALISVVANDLTASTNVSNSLNLQNDDFVLTQINGSGSSEGRHIRFLEFVSYSTNSGNDFIDRTISGYSGGEYFSYVATFNYGTATGISKIAEYNNFDASASGTTIQSGDLLLFVSLETQTATQSTLPAGLTEICFNSQGGVHGFVTRVAAKIADGTENGTDYGDTALLSTSNQESLIVVRKTGGSWNISQMTSSLDEASSKVPVTQITSSSTNVVNSTATSPTGYNNSISFNGNSWIYESNDTTYFDNSLTRWQFECYFYINTNQPSTDMGMIADQYVASQSGRMLFGWQNGSIVHRVNGGTIDVQATGLSIQTWYHVCLNYDGTLRLFIDGTLADSDTTPQAIYTGKRTEFGGGANLSNYDLDGYLQGIHFQTNPSSIRTGNFTPPSVIVAGSGTTLLIEAR